MTLKTKKTYYISMKHYRLHDLLLISLLLSLAGCHSKMNIQGTTSLAELEGRMLYLRIYSDGDLRAIDSSRVVHGRFNFDAEMDSVTMGSLFLGDESVMPIVIDETPLTITLTETERRVSGSELNDSLYAFIRKKADLDEQMQALPRRESQMILEGLDHADIIAQLNQEAAQLSTRNDQLVTAFIKAHMDDPLGPGVFMIATSNYPYPVLTPQIEELITLASPYFRSHAYVQEYVRMAKENMEKMNE